MSAAQFVTTEKVSAWAGSVRAGLRGKSAEEKARADRYSVAGPTSAGHLVIMDDARCVATVKATGPDSRQLAARLSRAEPRTALLRHLLAELEADESRWSEEIAMIRAELEASGDGVPSR